MVEPATTKIQVRIARSHTLTHAHTYVEITQTSTYTNMIFTRGAAPAVSYNEDAFLETHDRNLAEQGEVWHECRVVRPRTSASRWPAQITWLKSNGHANPGAGRVVVSCLLWMKQNIDAITPDPELDGDADILWDSLDWWEFDWPQSPPTTLVDVKAVFQAVYDELEGGDLACEPDDETCLLHRIFENQEDIMGAAQCGMDATNRTELVAAIDDLCKVLASAYMFEYITV